MANLWWGLEGAVSGSEIISVGSDLWADPESAVKLSWLIKLSCGVILTDQHYKQHSSCTTEYCGVLRITTEYWWY